MKVKINDLWKYRGDTIILNEKSTLVNEYLRPGVYTIVNKKDYGISIYNLATGESDLIDEWDENDEVEILIEAPEVKVYNLIQALVKEIINLSDEPFMHEKDIEFIIKEIEILRKTQRVLNSDSKDPNHDENSN